MSDAGNAESRTAVLAVGGLDPSNGAGVAVDAAVIREFGLHPLSVISGIAVQNSQRFVGRHDLSADAVGNQLRVLEEEFPVGAIKTGMLGSAAVVDAVGEWLEDRPRLPLVMDPVLRATSGGELAADESVAAWRRVLFPRARVLTPNLDEAGALTGRVLRERNQIPDAASALLDLGPRWVLIKGGHLPQGRASDYLAGPDTAVWLEESRRTGGSIRGTGCALASAIAAGLALGESTPEAVHAAKTFVLRAIDHAYAAGRGRFLGFTTSAPGS